MRIDQPEPGEPGALDALGAPRGPGALDAPDGPGVLDALGAPRGPGALDALGVPRGPGAERRGPTGASAERAQRPEAGTEYAHRDGTGTGTAQERPARPETDPERTARQEKGAPPEHPPLHRADAGPEDASQQAAKAPVSRAEQIAAHLSYRETVSVTLQAAADRAAWTDALPRLLAAWEEHKERYPEPARAAPRTEPDGSWTSGEHRRLDPEQNTEASKAHTDLADEAGRHILPALRRIEAADPERQLAGLEHMVKGEDRLKEKLADAWSGRPGLRVGQLLGIIPDSVRSTLIYSSERYAEGVITDVNRIEADGFELVRLKNLWHADQYKGVNSQWIRSDSGTRFEMQFHTQESLEAKELTHEAYERIRANAVLPADQQDLNEERDLENFQRRVNTHVAIPPGIDRIKDFPEKKDG